MIQLKRYIFNNKLNIIAPPKCGTRWLEYMDVPNRTHRFSLTTNELSRNVNNNTVFIWRPVEEHFISALTTDMYLLKDLKDVVYDLEYGNSNHWYPYLYKELYEVWSVTKFGFCNLMELSTLNEATYNTEFDSRLYKFSVMDGYDNYIEDIPLGTMKRIRKLIDEESKFLNIMVSDKFSKKMI